MLKGFTHRLNVYLRLVEPEIIIINKVYEQSYFYFKRI